MPLNAPAHSPVCVMWARIKYVCQLCKHASPPASHFPARPPSTLQSREVWQGSHVSPGPASLQGHRATGQEVTPATLRPAGGPGKVTSGGPVPAASTASQQQDGRPKSLRQICRVSMWEIYYHAKCVCKIHTSPHMAL